VTKVPALSPSSGVTGEGLGDISPGPSSHSALGHGLSAWWLLGWLVPLAVQIVHAVVVAPAYHVGSFDDDANYLMAAHTLAAGGGLTATMPSGASVVANYLPGYPALLVPLIWLFGAVLWPPRALSLLCVGALYPLLWAWMGRRDVKPTYRVAVLGLLAMNFVVATYATMVMAEAPFLVVLLLALLVLDRWERQPGWRWACAEVVLLAELVWLKEAGVGLAVGLVLYELWRRRWRRAVGVGAGVGLLLFPGLIARWLTGGAVVGNRYAGEIANNGQGGAVAHLPTEAVQDIWSYLQNVLQQSVLPSAGPWLSHGVPHVLVTLVGATVPVFSVLGAAVWYRRHPRAESWMVWAYFTETLGYPFTNQRRVILVLPVVTLWYVVGACAFGRFVMALSGRALSRLAVSVSVVVAVLLAGVPTAVGFTKDYLYRVGQHGAEFAHSPAMALLKAIRPPSAVVETDYRGSVAYFSGHRTAWTAFTSTSPYGPFASENAHACTLSNITASLRADDASLLVMGDFNVPGLVDSPCLLRLASSPLTAGAMGAVRLLSTDHDHTSVFELVGAGSSQPDLVDRTVARRPESPAVAVMLAPNGQGDAGGAAYDTRSAAGRANLEWAWPEAVPLSQVSVGQVTSSSPISAATVAIEQPDGTWQTLASAAGPVGDGGTAPYLLATLPTGTKAIGLRVSALTSGTAEVAYVNAVGPVP